MKNTTFKTLILSAVFGLSALAASAQSADIQTKETAPSAISISGQVEAGMRSLFSGNYKNGANSNQLGGYTRPEFDLGFAAKPVDISLSYILTAFGGKSFGSAAEERDFGSNMYFEHNPTLIIKSQMTDKWSSQFIADFDYQNVTGNQSSNATALALEPSLSYKIGDRVTLSGAYYFERNTNPNAVGLSNDDINEVRAAKDMASVSSKLIEAATPSETLLHAGKAQIKVSLPGEASWTTYGRAGRTFDNKASDFFQYRLHSELVVKPATDLSVRLRYRLTVADYNTDSYTKFTNQGRVIASYSVNPNLSVDLENYSTFAQSTKAEARASFSNEQFLGMTYHF